LIEIREITMPASDQAIVVTSITLAFQFKKTDSGYWDVDAVRLGDRDWIHMAELLAAIYASHPQIQTLPSAPKATPPEAPPTTTLHVKPNEFELQRRSMVEIGSSPLVPDDLDIRRVVSQNDVRAIAESTITASFRFRKVGNEWRVEAAQLGNRGWINVNDLLATFNEGRRRDTSASLQKLVAGINNYRTKTGALPNITDIVQLTDLLHPNYMTELVRVDGWGRPIEVGMSGTTFRLLSRGADGRLGTPDDVSVSPAAPIGP